MIILILVLCGFLYLFGENKSLEIVWLASHENMLKKSDCFTDITIRTSKCSKYRLMLVLNKNKWVSMIQIWITLSI